MKKNFLLIVFSILSMAVSAQSPVFMNLRNAIFEQHPELDLDDKLIAFNVWSVDDQASRAANKSFDKAARVYQRAILKGGRRGIVVVAINLDNLTPEANIVFGREGVNYLISMKSLDIPNDEIKKMKNAVYDSYGNEVYRDLPHNQIYPSINQLITR